MKEKGGEWSISRKKSRQEEEEGDVFLERKHKTEGRR
jgi:hypothetical protein